MDEAGARALLERVAAATPPPPKVDAGLARQRGRRRLRWRRAVTVTVPAVVAGVAAALIHGGVLAPGRGATGAEQGPRPVPATKMKPPRRFDPLKPYAAFGWLPAADARAGLRAEAGVSEFTVSTTGGEDHFVLTVQAPNVCHPATPGRRLPLVRCSWRDGVSPARPGGPGAPWQAIARAPEIGGKPAFWFRARYLGWEYAPHAWAALGGFAVGPTGAMSPVRPATLVKVADHLVYGAVTKPVILFPYQFTGLPRSWSPAALDWRTSVAGRAAALAARATAIGEDLTAGPLADVAFGVGRGRCVETPDRPVILHGVQAILSQSSPPGRLARQTLCVPYDDGLTLSFVLFRPPGSHAFPLGGVTGIFLHHLRLLGPGPANWTTRPLG